MKIQGLDLNQKNNICSYHDKISHCINRVLDMKENDYESVSDLLSDVQYWVDDARRLLEYATEAGKSMEIRLSKYRDAIEGLGFVREK